MATDGPPPPEFLAAAMRAQEAASGRSLDVRYTDEPEAVSPEGDRYRRVRRYVRTPDVLVLENTDEIRKQGNADWTAFHRSKLSYNRTTHEVRSVTYKTPGPSSSIVAAETSHSIAEPFVPGVSEINFLDTVTKYTVGKRLCDDVAEGQVSDGQEEVDGRMCWKVSLPQRVPHNPYCIVWLDSSLGCCPRRIDYMTDDGIWARVRLQDYREAGNGVWFPMHTIISSEPGSKRVNHCLVQSVSVDQPLSDDDLTVVFPANAAKMEDSIPAP